MKQLTTYNRVAGYLNKIFDLLNEHYFQGELARPTITIQSTPKAYGHFSTRPDTWVSVTGNSFELNLGAGTIGRPIEEVCATVLHETVHYYCCVNGIKDTSRGNLYHVFCQVKIPGFAKKFPWYCHGNSLVIAK